MAASAEASARRAAAPEDLVKLDPDHPGFRDPVYRARRNDIARVALEYVLGEPIPRIAYADDEHALWRAVWEHLAPLHERYACRAYKEGCGLLALDHARIPHLGDLNAVLGPRTGFRMVPVAGLVASRAFLSNLGAGVFLSTQYIRHGSRPLYTPEPDVVHELVGHAATFCSPSLARLNRLFGAAAAQASDELVVALERLYWFTVEFGVVHEDGGPKAYGAGLLSSFGELGRFEAEAEIKPFDPDEVAGRAYDPTNYQGTIYVVPSVEALTRDLAAWLAPRLPRGATLEG
jgi:phenylalanine-4-hydroxylase